MHRGGFPDCSEHMGRTLTQWLSHMDVLHAQVIHMGLERVSRVRESMGLVPDVPVITVTGTNGKGSTCACMAACLRAQGYRVGVYSSPHLVAFNERVQLGEGLAVDDQSLCAAFEVVESARSDQTLTPFEFATLAACQVFKQVGLDAWILEVGMGGRLDAVNIFDADCAVVTSIDLDHEAWLGDTREAIGFEKAGIFRAGKPAICTDPMPPDSISRSARQTGAQLLQIGQDFFIESGPDHWTLRHGQRVWAGFPLPAMKGEFQLRNAAAAVMALSCLEDQLPVSRHALDQGIASARLPGRFQKIANHPEVILDVAHNPHAAASLAVNLKCEPCKGDTLAVFGMLSDKDMKGVVAQLDDRVDLWCLAPVQDRRGASLEELQGVVKGVRGKVLAFHSPAEAYEGARQMARPEDRIVVLGSFVTVGAVMAHVEAISRSTGG